MGLDQTVHCKPPDAPDDYLPDNTNLFFYWRKAYELHQLVLELAKHPRETYYTPFSCSLDGSQINLIEQAVAQGRLVSRRALYGSLLGCDGTGDPIRYFFRLARLHLAAGRVIIYVGSC